jgi:bile acid-coenzyme A ligase
LGDPVPAVAPHLISFGRRIAEVSQLHPDKVAMIHVAPDGGETVTTWREVEDRSLAAARLLAANGVVQGSVVAIALGREREHFFFCTGAWKLGATVLPMNPGMPAPERARVLELAKPKSVVAGDQWADERTIAAEAIWTASPAGPPLPDRVPQPGKVIASGGSTGLPKLIVSPGAWAWPEEPNRGFVGFAANMVQLVTGPLHHNSPFSNAHRGLFYDHLLVVMDRFDAELAVDLVERHRVTFLAVVPTVMKRILESPQIGERDLSSIEVLFHTGAPCPPWVKEGWIGLIGGPKVWEAFGGTEQVGAAAIRGDEWLLHKGSLGKPFATDVRVLNDAGDEVESGVVGEIFMRQHGAARTYEYIGAPAAKSTADGFSSLGDMGWMDKDGYLYLADRRVDIIITGGSNVYPAEVENVLSEHPAVEDVTVIGVPDPEWGRRVHAIVQLRPAHSETGEVELIGFCRERLTSYKVPKTVEFIARLPRDETGKVRRTALVAERTPANVG